MTLVVTSCVLVPLLLKFESTVQFVTRGMNVMQLKVDPGLCLLIPYHQQYCKGWREAPRGLEE